ncbi:MAG: class D sortase [Oscillospiraceae bacterium]|jgi:sortase A|nr:class D sortase [Oscillospiraceae bacterium]
MYIETVRQYGSARFSKRSKYQRFRRIWRLAALVFIPILFTILTAVVMYTALEPIIGHYAGTVLLFVNNYSSNYEAETANLLEIRLAEPNEDPVNWVSIDDHSNPEILRSTDSESGFIKRSEITVPHFGDLYAHITISGTTVDAPVFWGDSEIELNRGVGTYIGGWLPGFGRTVMMAAHRATDFRDLGSVEIGSVITVQTHYETYTYEVTEIAVFHMNDDNAYDFLVDEENIILYTCYPFDFVGAARERFFVYGKPLTGTPVARYS